MELWVGLWTVIVAFPSQTVLRPKLFYKLIYGNFISDLGSGGRKIKNKKALKMTS